MRRPRSLRSGRALLNAFAFAIVLGLATALAPVQPHPSAEEPAGAPPSSTHPAPFRTGAQGFPEPAARAWALVVLCGALGAVAGELVAGGGQLAGRRRDRAGWALGLAGRSTVGAVAAMLVLSLSPPGGSWLRLVGAGLGSGVAGEAVLLAILASRRAQAAEKNLEAAEAQAALGATLAIEKIETFRVLALAARRGAAVGHAAEGSTSHCPGHEDAAGELAEFDQLINTYAERAKAEIAAAG